MTIRRLGSSGGRSCGPFTWGVLLAALFASSNADAQEWLKDRRFNEGAGLKAGDFELHPGLAGEVGYDSNWFLRSNKSGAGIVNGEPAVKVQPGGLLRITPSLTLSTAESGARSEGQAGGEPRSVEFRAGVAATYREYIGVSELRDQRNISGNANFRLDILPGRPWGAAVFGTYARTIQPTVLGNPDLSFNRDDLGVGGELIAQPNSGTLDWRLGYRIQGALFESENGAPYSSTGHILNTRGRWKFRPRTALLYDGTFSFSVYPNATRATTQLLDSTPLRARFGMSGLVTPNVSVLAMAGYGSTFFKGGSSPTVRQYDSVIGQAQVTFYPNPSPQVTGDSRDASLTLSSIALGYNRDFQNSYLGNFYGTDRGYAKIAYFFAGRALISLEGGVGAIEYPDIFANAGPGTTPTLSKTAFTDIRVDATLFAEYRIVETVGINASVIYGQNFSKNQIPVGGAATPGAAPQVFDMNWQRVQAFLGARWFY